ncbi:uncharacterized protein LOC132741893 [Ruditapes philippinarum]|uniref:uncharacterized protein LOC132741893 n=1 Tax=Ruditapes philippinarum TaxID=129788 RepID=UPI00295B9B33|nr:uncharacterized protein LOC132741893 [Ruditapes philippinarum]
MADGGIGSDEFVNFKCCLCEKKHITKEADIYCVECQEYYCTPCTDLHKLFSSMSTHQFIDKSSFNTVSLQKSLPSFPVEKCEAHKTKLLDMYCADHDDVACATCIAIKHRTCQHIHSIPDEVDDLCKEIDADKILVSIELICIKTKIEEAERAKKFLIKELNVQKEKATESIRQFRKEMEVILDTLEKNTLKILEEKYKTGKEKLENEIKNLHRHINELKLSSQKVIKSVGNKAQEFVAVKTYQKQIIEAYEAEAESMTNSSAVKVEFIADWSIKDALKDYKTFGLISVSDTESMRDNMYVVKSKKQVNIKHENDKRTCNVNGSCFTDDGLLFLADYYNKTLKLIDLSSESIKDKLNLEASPYKICQISKNDFAVSLNNKTIQFVTMGSKLTNKQLKLDHDCYGLAYKDNKLFISDSRTALYIHDMNGILLQKITSDKQGNAIFKSTRGISVSSDGKMIYVADGNKGLIVLDIEGNYKTTITDPDFINLYGVCTDKRGNIFVCGWGQSKIVQINEKSAVKLGVLGNVNCGLSCSFLLKHNRLAVTIGNSDTIEVFDLL